MLFSPLGLNLLSIVRPQNSTPSATSSFSSSIVEHNADTSGDLQSDGKPKERRKTFLTNVALRSSHPDISDDVERLQADFGRERLLSRTLSDSADEFEGLRLRAGTLSSKQIASEVKKSNVLWLGKRTLACLSQQNLTLKHVDPKAYFSMFSSRLCLEVPVEEIIGAEVGTSADTSYFCNCMRETIVRVHTFKRKGSMREWVPFDILFFCESAQEAVHWVDSINNLVMQLPGRPRRLLVFINPFGGANKAASVWKEVAQPIFLQAHIDCDAIETAYAGHAQQLVEKMGLQELSSYDGLIAVGGDGLFQEIMCGLLAHRRVPGSVATIAANMRLGHIAAGSTDAVTYTVNGTRSASAAALHVALGDRMPLDVMEVQSLAGERRFAVCLASYGFMGDLMKRSEGLRWVGPVRYDVAGAMTFLNGRAYYAHIKYKPATPTERSRRNKCRSDCEHCLHRRRSEVVADIGSPSTYRTPCSSPCIDDSASPDPFSSLHSQTSCSSSGAEDEWRVWEGEIMSLMCAVTPCRSDKSRQGVMPYAHLNDGRLHLVIVKRTSRVNFLRFLLSLSSQGVDDSFPFVETKEVTAFTVTPSGDESAWNIDGELLEDNNVSARVHCGLIDVFARGVELPLQSGGSCDTSTSAAVDENVLDLEGDDDDISDTSMDGPWEEQSLLSPQTARSCSVTLES